MEKGKPIQVGVLGAGGILGAHVPALRHAGELGLCDVRVVAETSPGRDETIRSRLGDTIGIVRDYREVLAMPEIDAVVILLPHVLHMPATVEAASAGKHVLVEKVMARNVWECDRMIEACEHAGVTLTVCHDRRYHSQWMALKSVVDSGLLGEIFSWKLEHNQNVAIPDSSWAYWKDGIGGGSIMSCLTHQIDGLRWMGGEVEQVSCMSMARPERMQGEFLGSVLARMHSGALAQLSINWWTRSNGADNGLWYELIHVCGTKGEAYFMTGRGTWLLLHERSDEAVRRYGEEVFDHFVHIPDAGVNGHMRCTEQWLRMLRGEPSEVSTTGRDSRQTVEVAEAAYLSVEQGANVTLPIKPKPWVPVGMPLQTGGFMEGLDPVKGIKA